MANGFMGKLLNVDLAGGRLTEEPLDETLCRDYVGGYGLGARLLYERIPKGADPLGPQNVLGILTGPLTGTAAIIGSRFVAVAKSPKTGGWGDANCGGHFGPHLKFAGFDGVLFSGISAKPVYLFIDEGRAQLLDAADLWGLGVTALEDLLVQRHGKGTQVCSIGPAGERLALSACIMNDKERAAGRSGLGAVMGSKRLKCIVVKGKMAVPVHDAQQMKELRKKYLKQATGAFEVFNRYGTAGITHDAILSGDAPVKNWGGAGATDFPSQRGRRISDEAVVSLEGYKSYGCWHCPIACGGRVTQTGGRFPLTLNDGVGHKPEYETLAMFGPNLLNDDLASIVKLNEICNNLGMDTITVGATIAYALECCENGLLSRQQTDGLDLRWGNAEAIVALAEKIGRREGFGDLLADGVWAAWKRLGRIGTEYAVHIQGEEIPAHDPKFTPGLASTYWLTATPGRHTQGGELVAGPGVAVPDVDKYAYSGRAEGHHILVAAVEVVNAAGLCLFGYLSYPFKAVLEQLAAATGEAWDMGRILTAGTRIYTMRHAFNLREGLNPLARNMPGRIVGEPPLREGNVKEITVDYRMLAREFLERLNWDPRTTVPEAETLEQHGMEFLADDLRHANVAPA
ncbi:MAG: aldehyde ferredoxin oxidoreductase family protein [Desulfobacterales bacterium]|jgi:aldehyde:ferredoxin oxidoreductase|nr:aldehyde ferredoxin oxidoreductase family protein [Desulfobacterales bacterium]